MARYDKSSPFNSTFRAHVATDYPDADLGKLFAVGLDSAGKIAKGGGQTGIIAVLVCTDKPGVVGPRRQVSRLDPMKSGEVTDFGPTSGTPGVTFGVAGTNYFGHADGTIDATKGADGVYVGTTVEPDRLIVNVQPIA